MKRFTQTALDPGNCWQTAVACVLEIPPAELPDQVEIERAGVSYHNALNSYLIIHHGLMYGELCDWQFSGLRVRFVRFKGYHVICGPTHRTAENGIHHAMVGRFGRPVWDVHPSRAGLLTIEKWGTMGDANDLQRESRTLNPESDSKYSLSLTCLCPSCMNDAKRDLLNHKENSHDKRRSGETAVLGRCRV